MTISFLGMTELDLLRQIAQDMRDLTSGITSDMQLRTEAYTGFRLQLATANAQLAAIQAHLSKIDQSEAALLAKATTEQAAITKGFSDMSGQVDQLQTEIDQLTASVSQNTDASTSIEATLDKVFAMLSAAATGSGATPAQLASITSAIEALKANTSGLVASALANTPADPNAGGGTPAPAPTPPVAPTA